MDFRTEIVLPRSGYGLNHSMKGFMAGSCFAENIYARLSSAKFSVAANPFGIMFNPLSVCEMFRTLADVRRFTKDDLYFDGDLWHSWLHHGSFSGTDADSVLAGINASAEAGARALASADYVIITFGTAWMYRLTTNGRIAANCHKQPQAMFVRERLSAADIIEAYSKLIQGVLKDKKIIFTVSPVRHLKDGFAENSLSKSILRVAVGELTERYPDVCDYFPAYEIVCDDLRDYRFYADDMVHPSPKAVDYIWAKFSHWAMDDKTLALLPQLNKISQAMGHRVINPHSAANGRFMSAMKTSVVELAELLPEADFSAELKYFGQL